MMGDKHEFYQSPRSIDKEKEASRYDRATDAAIERIQELWVTSEGQLEGHPLADIYVQELVRCETVHMMKSGDLQSADKLRTYLKGLVRTRLGVEVSRSLEPSIQTWVREFRKQLGQAAEVTQRKRQSERTNDPNSNRKVPSLALEAAARSVSSGRYAFNVQNRGDSEFAVIAEPLFGTFDVHRMPDVFGPEFDNGFPLEIDEEGYFFLVDYDGSIVTYGQGELVGKLLWLMESLSRKLEHCFVS